MVISTHKRVLILLIKNAANIPLPITFGGPIIFYRLRSPVRDASGIFFCRFLKIISQMFDGFKEKCYLCRRNEEINDSYS